MRITIFSLGGVLGQYVTNTALLHGAQVTAYVPDAKAIWPRKNMTVIEGSLQNRERVLEALLEADAVISVLTPMRVKHVKEEETPLAWRLRGQIPENEYEIHADFLARCL